jgi:hypothetical protein
MPKELKWKEAIDQVLLSAGSAMHYEDIANEIARKQLRTELGATPAASVNSNISWSVKHDGDKSPYVRVSKGVYALRTSIGKRKPDSSSKTDATDSEDDDVENQYEIVTSFGMFWRREHVEWLTTSTKLLGSTQIGATPVDFSNQIGIYMLYDGREVIYVGRSIDRPFGKRLYEHTLDRMSTRWDRFSWFGLRPVSDKAELGVIPKSFNSEKLIPALEAILIEALEPRQNRKRGDDLSAVEYHQSIDPAIEKRLKRSIAMKLIDNLD